MKKLRLLFLLITALASAQKQPNIILINVDDMGYGDLGCFGSEEIETPNLDTMAKEGMKFTNFYAAMVCGPSRAQLMTGSYHPRTNSSYNEVPGAKSGLNSNEITLAEVLKGAGYTTMHVGKWHLGELPEFSPNNQGFDEFWGYPYSHDMWPYHCNMEFPEKVKDQALMQEMIARKKKMKYSVNRLWNFPDLPLMDNEKVIEYNPEQSAMTTRFTEKSIEFIKQNYKKPFFLYLAHPMPHTPLFVSKKFAGKSKRGLFGDAVMEVDWSYGEIVKTLKKLKIDKKTLIIFTSDNGPTTKYGRDGGSAGVLRGGKTTLYEGGLRVPCIMRWPGRIKPNTENHNMTSTIDMLPTFATIGGGTTPTDRVIDGKDISPLFKDEKVIGPHKYIHYFGGNEPGTAASYRAIRNEKWKLFINKVGKNKFKGIELYNLVDDVSETRNVAKANPQVVQELVKAAEAFYTEFEQNKRPGGGTFTRTQKRRSKGGKGKKGKGKKKKKK